MSFLMSSSYLLFGLPCGPTDISCDLYTFFLPFSLPAFDVNGQTSLIVVLLCDLLYSYVLLIHLIHRLFWFSMHHLFFCRNKNLSLQLSFQMPGGFQRTDNITVLPTAGQKFPRCFKGLLGVFFSRYLIILGFCSTVYRGKSNDVLRNLGWETLVYSSEVCHPRCVWKINSEVNSVRKHNYNCTLDDGIY